ncbi:substrate-binding periplasmic protein [Vibrio sp. MA40-2]|uniref:substrate-binding periplasmic protein n=1 Tax=Vibrio sp. MA40-2 TaxID=3391828 RepID=UPI0039A64284
MRSIILIFVLFFTIVSKSYADNPDSYGCNESTISVGITDTGVMYHNGQGVDADLFSLLSEITDCKFNLIPIARENAFNLMEQGEIDLVPSVTREPHREAFAWFIPYYEIRFLLLENGNTLPPISHLDQLKTIEGASIARASGSGYGTYFNYHLAEMGSLGMVRLYPDYGKTIQAFLNQEVDATLSLPQIYRVFFAPGEEPFPIRIADVSPENPVAISLMLGKHQFSSAQIANWLRVIEAIRLDGRLQAILEQYVSTEEAASMLGLEL